MNISIPSTLLASTLLALAASSATAQTANYLALDGTGDYVVVSGLSNLDGMDAYTLELWFRSTSLNNGKKMIDMGTDPNYRMGISAANQYGGSVRTWNEKPGKGTQADSPFTPATTDGAWHHLASVEDGTLLRLYLDGVEIANAPSLGETWNMNGRTASFGAHVVGFVDHFAGDLDELRIWRRALSPAEVATSATWQLPCNTTGLVSWYPFEIDASDAIGANDGTLMGDAAIVANPGFIDCNGNGIDDGQDLATGTSSDCNGDGVPDECQPMLWKSTGFSAGVPSDMTLADNATWIGGAVRLNGAPGSHGSADYGSVRFDDEVWIDPQASLGLEWSFRFRMLGGYDIERTHLRSSDFGIPGKDSYEVMVEFDHHYNSDQPPSEEPNGNHMSITLQTWIGGVQQVDWLAHYTPSFTLANGGWHTARLRVHDGALSVWVTPEGGVEEQAFDAVPLPMIWSDYCWTNVSAWNGSGPGGNEHWVDDLSVFTGPCGSLAVTEILPRASWESSDLLVLGAGFDGAESVTVDGLPAVVSTWTPDQLQVAWPQSAPGTFDVIVTKGADQAMAPVDLWPVLEACSTGIGGQATVDLSFSGSGLGVLAISGQASPPVPISGSWHGLELDPVGLSVLGVAVIGPAGETQWVLSVPQDPTLSGLAVEVQAWAQEGFFQSPVSSFSNRVTLVL